jgi:large subunit ribosomal protein L27
MAKKRAGGVTKNTSDSAGRRLGFKIYPSQRIDAGAIIIRQRGTLFYPGLNVVMGNDHTINAILSGTVKMQYMRIGNRLRRVISVYDDNGILNEPEIDTGSIN